MNVITPAAVETVAKGGWTYTGIITSITGAGTFGVVLTAFFKWLPTWKELGIGQRRDELTRINTRLDKVETENKELRKCVADSDKCVGEVRMKMVTLNTACQLLAGELAKVSPGNPVIAQAKELIRQAVSDDLGWGEDARRLANIPGIIREQQKQQESVDDHGPSSV